MRDELVKFWDDSDHDIARINRASTELSYAILKMLQFGRTRHALIFGSARFKPDNPYYQMTEELAYGLIKREVGVITGGGPGIMEAGNLGALRACNDLGLDPARLVSGFNITLPFEQSANPALTVHRQVHPGRTPPPRRGKLINFHYFFARKYVFARFGMALFCLPGGFGTMDETFEFLTLIQTGKLTLRPVVFLGKGFWEKFWLPAQELMLEEGVISEQDQYLVHSAHTPEEALAIYDHFYKHLSTVRYFRSRKLVLLSLDRKHPITQEHINTTLSPYKDMCKSAELTTLVDVPDLTGPEFFLVKDDDMLEKTNGHLVLRSQGQIWRLQNPRIRPVIALHGFDMHSFGNLSRFVMDLQK